MHHALYRKERDAMKVFHRFVTIQVLLALVFFSTPARAGETGEPSPPPVLTVKGSGEVTAKPDQAVIRVGALIQDREAAQAQYQVNRILERALKNIKALSIPKNKISTVGLSLSPVYAGEPRRPGRDEEEPRIVGYRARSSIEVRVEDLDKAGKVIDAAISSGGNRVEGISFGLKDDLPYRLKALRLAMGNARLKAGEIAEAGGFVLGTVKSVTEQQVGLIRPKIGGVRALAAAETAAQVEPGEIRVEASVIVEYLIGE